jgi:hypothetical protein
MIPNVQVRGVLVNENNPNGSGVLVSLTLFRADDSAGIAPDPQMQAEHGWPEQDWEKRRIGPCFAKAAKKAFGVFWHGSGGVRWLLTRDEVEKGKRGTLPKVEGASLGAAFAAGLNLLQGADREALVARLGLPLIPISAALGERSRDDMRLGEVGGLGAKVRALQQQGLLTLAVYEEQKDLDGCGLRIIKAGSVGSLMIELAQATGELVGEL